MIIAVVLTFIAVFLLIATVYLGMTITRDSPTATLKRRMRHMAASGNELSEDMRSEIAREVPPFEKMLAQIPVFRNLELALDYAGLSVTVTTYLFVNMALFIVSVVLVYVIFQKLYLVPVAAVLVILGSFQFLRFKRARRIAQFTEQLPDVLSMISRSLRSGHSMTSAVELVGQEMTNPAAELFKTAYDQQNLGLRITETLSNMVHRVDSLDLRFFVTSVQINSEVGGNLSEVLDNLASIIRERLKIRRQVSVYTAQGRMSGYVLASLPFAVFLILRVIMPEYVGLLTSTKLGITMLIVAVVMQFIGLLVIRKVIDIRI